MYRFRCSACGGVLKVPDRALGRRVACSKAGCAGQTRLPSAAEVETLPWARCETTPEGPRRSPGLLERRRLRRQVRELEDAVGSRLRDVGAGALDPLAGGQGLGEARAEVVAAGSRLARARDELNAVAGASAKSSVADDLRREVDRRARERDEAIARLGRKAVQLREKVEPAALADVERLDGLLAERRARLGGEVRPFLGRLRAATARLARAAAFLLVLFGSGWGGFTALEHVAKSGPPSDGASGASKPPPPAPRQQALVAAVEAAEASVCLIAHGYRITQVDGTVTELLGGWGTGFAITPDGSILTNGHVVSSVWPLWDAAKGEFRDVLLIHESGVRLQVRPVVWAFFGKDRKYEARLVDYQLDDSTGADVCLMKVDRPDGASLPLSLNPRPARGTRIKALGFPDYAAETLTGDDAHRKRMQSVQALSLEPSKIEDSFKPDDYEFSQTSGEVSKVADPGGSGDRPWIFHTADLSHGNSGGPLIADAGIVIGVNTKYAKGGGAGEVGPASGFLAQTTPQFRKMIETKAPAARWLP